MVVKSGVKLAPVNEFPTTKDETGPVAPAGPAEPAGPVGPAPAGPVGPVGPKVTAKVSPDI